MKFITVILCAVALTTAAYSQTPDKTLAKVRYTFIHVRDTNQRDKPYTENMVMLIGKNASLYTSYDKSQQAIIQRQKLMEQIKNMDNSGPKGNQIVMTAGAPVTRQDYFYFANENKFYTKESMINQFLVEEPPVKIDWKITKDTASFSGVHSQKATTHFKGRNWIAWFATELPFQSGPWKLHGLPGLIIEAYDEKKEVQFKFAGIENVDKVAEPSESITTSGITVKVSGLDTDLGDLIKLPIKGVKVTPQEFARLKKANEDDPEGFFNSQKAAMGINGVFKSSTNIPKTGNTLNKPVINNPLELPEKK